MSGKEPRPTWDVIQTWRVNRDAVIEKVTGLCFTVEPEAIAYGVLMARRQVAVFTLDELGEFRWGWVEHASKNGRTDYRSFPEWAEALINVHSA